MVSIASEVTICPPKVDKVKLRDRPRAILIIVLESITIIEDSILGVRKTVLISTRLYPKLYGRIIRVSVCLTHFVSRAMENETIFNGAPAHVKHLRRWCTPRRRHGVVERAAPTRWLGSASSSESTDKSADQRRKAWRGTGRS